MGSTGSLLPVCPNGQEQHGLTPCGVPYGTPLQTGVPL